MAKKLRDTKMKGLRKVTCAQHKERDKNENEGEGKDEGKT